MKFNLHGLLAYLQGKGYKVKLNEDAESEEETFEIREEEVIPQPDAELSPPDELLSAEELSALKRLATVLAKNGNLIEVIDSGDLDEALKTVPAAAELVRNAQAQSKAEKDSLIATIKANSANIYSDEELNSMSNPVLVKLNAQLNVNYMGLGGAFVQQNASEEPLSLPTSSFFSQEVSDGS